MTAKQFKILSIVGTVGTLVFNMITAFVTEKKMVERIDDQVRLAVEEALKKE